MKKKVPKYFILDVDGVMTDGTFLYSEKGKIFKRFGPHDSDGLKIISKYLNVMFVSSDKRGFKISKKRITDDMGYKIKLVLQENRLKFIRDNFGLKNVVYMGDGIFDAPILKKVLFGIAPQNSRIEAKKMANFITPSNAANGAVLDACLKILNKFF